LSYLVFLLFITIVLTATVTLLALLAADASTLVYGATLTLLSGVSFSDALRFLNSRHTRRDA
jgi:hypothetical protein